MKPTCAHLAYHCCGQERYRLHPRLQTLQARRRTLTLISDMTKRYQSPWKNSPVASNLAEELFLHSGKVLDGEKLEVRVAKDHGPGHHWSDFTVKGQAVTEVQQLQQVRAGHVGHLVRIRDIRTPLEMGVRWTCRHEGVARNLPFRLLGSDAKHLHMVHTGFLEPAQQRPEVRSQES